MAGALKMHQADDRHQRTDMQAVRRRIEAGVQGEPLLLEQLAEFRMRYLADQAPPGQFFVQGHRCSFIT